MRRTILTALLAMGCPLFASPVKIHGYVTGLSSPKQFEIDHYRITRDDSLVFEVDQGDNADANFRPEDLRIGAEVDVQGDFNDSTQEVHAARIKVVIADNLRVKRVAIIEHTSVLQRDGNTWQGAIRADGETIKVNRETRVVLKEGQTNRLTPGLAISYEGRREKDGSMLASKLEILPNEAGKSELKLVRETAPKLNSDGDILVRGAKYKLVPDAEAQSYVQRTGTSLVPNASRQDLSGSASRRLSFQFYLVENSDFNAHAFPNGTVLVNSGVLRVLTSEGQLAAVLSHEIAHATQEHAFREIQHQKGGKGSVSDPAVKADGAETFTDPFSSGYSRSLENQADRVGLTYMVAAGYDPREAAEVWNQVAKARGDNKKVVWNSQDDTTLRRSYLISELANNYSNVDFRGYTRDRDEFDQLATRFGNTSLAQTGRQNADPPAAARPNLDKRAQALSAATAVHVSTASNESPAPHTPRSASPSPGTHFGANAVTINSDPPGANVMMDGRVIGVTPMVLPTGNAGMPFVITVRKTGYRDWTGQLVSVPGRTILRVELLPAQ